MPIPNITTGGLNDARRLQVMQEGVQCLRVIAQSLQQIQATLQRMEMKVRS